MKIDTIWNYYFNHYIEYHKKAYGISPSQKARHLYLERIKEYSKQ